MKFNETYEGCTSFMMFDGVAKALFYLVCGLKSFFETWTRSLRKLCMHSINLWVWTKRRSFFFGVFVYFFEKMRRFTQVSQSSKGIRLVFGVCFSLKECGWFSKIVKTFAQALPSFFWSSVNMKAILFLFLCVAPYHLFFYCYGSMT